MDVCHFEIDDIEVCYVFSKNTAFKDFADKMMKKRIENPESSEFYKLVMNSTYGSLIKNQEKYTHSVIADRHLAEMKKRSDHFRGIRELNDDVYETVEEITDEIIKKTESKKCKEYVFKNGEIQKLVRKAQYQVESVPVSFGCDTDIINGFFTLDNSKYIYLSFIYEFMYKCLWSEFITQKVIRIACFYPSLDR
jgi:hypothetical protein